MFVWRNTYLAKVRECEDLRHELNTLKHTCDMASVSQINLAGTIRNIDQLIARMGQCLDWESMRPLFNELQRGAETRQHIESELIGRTVMQDMKINKEKYIGP